MNGKRIGVPRQIIRLGVLLLVTTGLVACGGGGNDDDVQSVPLQPLAIDVLSAQVTPVYSLDGGTFQISEYNDGNFALRSRSAASDIALLGSSHDNPPAPVRIVQGNYDVLFQHETGPDVPQNVNTPVQSNINLSADLDPFNIPVSSWLVTPTFQHNGGAFPVTEYDDGVFYLQPKAGGERIFLGNSHTMSPDPVRVMEGSYDVIYSLESGGEQVPNNQNAVVMSNVLVNADLPLTVNVLSQRFQFDATLDSVAFPVNQYQKAQFFLRNSSGDRVDLAFSYELSTPVVVFVIEGNYDVVYQYLLGDDGLPANTDAVVASNILIDGTSQVQSIDISSVAITPSFALDGAAFPVEIYEEAQFFLRSVNNPNDEMLLGTSYFAPPAPVRVISSDDVGNYDVLYRFNSGTELPRNPNAVVQNNVVLNSSMNLAVADVVSVNISGSFTLNGNNFPGNAYDSAQFLLRSAGNASDMFLFGFSDLSTEAVKLISGSYDVLFDHLDGDAVPQNKMHVVRFNELLDTDKSLRINVQAKRVDASFTLDGNTFPASIYQSARFYLRDITTNKRIFLGNSYGNNSAVTVVGGTYDVIYEHRNGDEVPQNSDSKVGSVVVQ